MERLLLILALWYIVLVAGDHLVFTSELFLATQHQSVNKLTFSN